MASSTGYDGSIEFPEALVAATVRHAEHAADMVAQFLEQGGFRRHGPDGELAPIAVSGPLLLELAAFLEFCDWDKSGLRKYLGSDVPTPAQAARCLLRGGSNQNSFNLDDLPLTRQAMMVQTWRLAWQGPQFLGAEIVLTDADEDGLIDGLAEYAWSQRASFAVEENHETP